MHPERGANPKMYGSPNGEPPPYTFGKNSLNETYRVSKYLYSSKTEILNPDEFDVSWSHFRSHFINTTAGMANDLSDNGHGGVSRQRMCL